MVSGRFSGEWASGVVDHSSWPSTLMACNRVRHEREGAGNRPTPPASRMRPGDCPPSSAFSGSAPRIALPPTRRSRGSAAYPFGSVADRSLACQHGGAPRAVIASAAGRGLVAGVYASRSSAAGSMVPSQGGKRYQDTGLEFALRRQACVQVPKQGRHRHRSVRIGVSSTRKWPG